MTNPVPTTVDALMQIIDVLWGEVPVERVDAMRHTMPEIVDACRQIHNLLNHSPSEGP